MNDGLLQSNITDMSFDPNNFCWLSFANGVQKFDGKNFSNVPVQPGLPDDKYIKFFRTSKGILLLSHSKGISSYDHKTDKFKLIYQSRTDQLSPAQFLGEDDGRVYFYMLDGVMGELDIRNFKVGRMTYTGFAKKGNSNGFPLFCNSIYNHRIAIQANGFLYLWDLKEMRPAFEPVSLKSNIPFFLEAIGNTEVIYYVLGEVNELQAYDFVTKKLRTIRKNKVDYIRTFRALFRNWGGRKIQSYYNRLFEQSPDLSEITTELVNYQNRPIAGNATIALMRVDNFDNLYLVTINDGFRKIIKNNLPIKYYGNGEKDGNYSLALCIDKKNNRILSGTFGNGLLIFDTAQRLVKHIGNLPGTDHGFAINQIVKSEGDGYFLFSDEIAWHLSENLNSLSPIAIKRTDDRKVAGVGYFSNLLYKNKDSAIFMSQGHLYVLEFKSRSVTERDFGYFTALSSICYRDKIIIFENDELMFLDMNTLRERKKVKLTNTGGVRCYATDNRRQIYVGTNKGVFMLDSSGKLITVLGKNRGLPDECIYAMVLDKQGFLWCSTNKGVFKINSSNNIFQLNREDGLQENEFNTNIAALADDGEIFFGGVNGVSSFYPSNVSDFHEEIFLLLTELRINNDPYKTDTGIWVVDHVVLPYDKSSLSFDFIAMANNNPEQYTYQYMMEGVDKEWIQSGSLNTVRYFLGPGKYKFKVYAARFFDKRAKPMKEITIIIRPPYWQTWWFLSILGVLLVVAMAVGFNRYNRSKYEKRLNQFEAEQKLRLERERISRDLHDSIGAYANAVLYNTQRLEEEKVEEEKRLLMADLKYASKDIITSLRETIWALKKDHYTADDCLIRIRNFIQPFNRYYGDLKFRLEGDAPPNMTLHYTRALNLVRIVQEAVTNGIKHGNAKNIVITSKFNPQVWEVMVKDDGEGFNIDENGSEGNGLGNMKQRAIDSKFDISLQSGKNEGTTVCIKIKME